MSSFNIQNGQELNNKNVSLWRKGKQDIKKFYEIKLKKSTSIKTFLYGILLTAIIIIPFALILIELLQAFIYNLNLVLLFMTISWTMLWLCNGLSNLFTIKLAKLYYKEEPKLQAIDEYAVFFYETINPGFIIFSLFLVVLVFFRIIGA